MRSVSIAEYIGDDATKRHYIGTPNGGWKRISRQLFDAIENEGKLNRMDCFLTERVKNGYRHSKSCVVSDNLKTD